MYGLAFVGLLTLGFYGYTLFRVFIDTTIRRGVSVRIERWDDRPNRVQHNTNVSSLQTAVQVWREKGCLGR